MEAKALTIEQILERYPRITAHLIAESLGYFTPRGAANAILHYLRKQPFPCEWYSLIGYQTYGRWPNNEELIQIGENVLAAAIRERHRHCGFMQWYSAARALVEAEKQGQGPILASW
jgi:hypothetical protein